MPQNSAELTDAQQTEWAGRVADLFIAKFKERQEAREAQQRAQASAADSPEGDATPPKD